MKICILYIVVLVILTSCKSDKTISKSLDTAYHMIYSNPNQALEIIKSIDSEKIRDDETEARYALLYSQILNKNQIKINSDSLILTAVKYYQKYGSSKEKAQSFYYLGLVYLNKGETELALSSFFEAKQWAENTTSTYLKGHILYNIGKILFLKENIIEAKQFFDKSIEYLSQGNSTLNEAYALYSLGKIHALNNKYDLAIKCLNASKRIFEELNAIIEIQNITADISYLYIYKLNDLDGGFNELKIYERKYGIQSIPDIHKLLTAIIFCKKGNYEIAVRIGNNFLNHHQLEVSNLKSDFYLLLKKTEELRGNYRKALDYSYQYENLIQELYKQDKKQTIIEIKQKYNNTRLQEDYDQLKTNQRNIIIISLVSVFLILGLTCFYILRIRVISSKKYKENRDIQIIIEKIKQEKITSENNRNKFSKENKSESYLWKILSERLDIYKQLIKYASIYENNPTEFIDKFKSILRSNKGNKFFEYLPEVINNKYHGIVDHLKNNYPLLTQEDIQFCCLILHKLSATELCFIYGHTNPNTIYSKRFKLRPKLSLTNKDIVLETFLFDLAERLKQNSDNQ